MSKMIQIRHVPDDLHRTLKSRAALAGKSLSDYLREELERLSGYPSIEEWQARVRARGTATLSRPAADLVREARDRR